MNNVQIDVTIRDDGKYLVEAKDSNEMTLVKSVGPSLQETAQQIVDILQINGHLEEGYSLIITDAFGEELTITPKHVEQFEKSLKKQHLLPNLDIPEDVSQR